MAFDPTKYGAIPIETSSGFDPNKYGAVPIVTQSQQQETSSATFPATNNDTIVQAGLKTAGNLPSSAFNFAKGAVKSLNPINTLKNIRDVVTGVSDSNASELLDTVTGLPKAAFNELVPTGIKQLLSGDTQGAQKSFTNDPFGTIAPVVFALDGAAKVADSATGSLRTTAENNFKNFNKTGINVMPEKGAFSQALDTGFSKVAQPVTSLAKIPLGFTGTLAKSATAHLVGLEPTDITNIIQNPKAFSKVALDQVSRGGLASEFGNAVDNLETKLQDTGEAYNPIRTVKNPVAVPENFIPQALSKFGIKLENGKVIADSNSITRNPGDVNAIQRFVDNWGNKQTLTPNEFLNMRSDLGDLSRFDLVSGKTKAADVIGKELYAEANRTIRPQIQGLKQIDEQYAPLRNQFDKIKKDFLQKNPDGTYSFKDGAINRIANSTGVGKDQLLKRMEEVMPGISKKVQLLKTAEAIEKSYGNKVGNYARGILSGAAFYSMNPAAIIAAIISNPSVAVPLLRGVGYTSKMVAPIVDTLKIIAGDVNKLDSSKIDSLARQFQEGTYMTPNKKGGFIKNPLTGKEVVSLAEMDKGDADFLVKTAEEIKARKQVPPSKIDLARKTLEHYDFNAPKAKTKLADFILTADESSNLKTLSEGIDKKLFSKKP